MAALRQVIAGLLSLNLVVAGGTVAVRYGDEPGKRVTAHFTRTVGLYPGSSVRVLGVKVGKILSIVPEGRTVRVEMELDQDVPVPADAGAVIIPPSLVSDRYVQLHPAYTGGPVLADGADIPVAKTRTPIELDEIISSLDKLLLALGPNGANSDGSLSRLVDAGESALGGGNGAKFNTTITALAQAITTLAEGRDDLGGVLENLSSFTHTLAENDAKIRTVTRSLAEVTHQLAGEREALEQAMKNLAISLGEIGRLVEANRATIGQDIDSLSKLTRVLLKNRESLIEAMDTTPLVLANLNDAINAERQTLDIRNNNDQTSNPYDVLVCQLLAPILNVECPPAPFAPSRGTGRTPGTGASRGATALAAGTTSAPLDEFTLAGLLGGAR